MFLTPTTGRVVCIVNEHLSVQLHLNMQLFKVIRFHFTIQLGWGGGGGVGGGVLGN